MGEASLLHMSGPDIQQLFAQAVGVGDGVGVAVGFAVVGAAVVGCAVVGAGVVGVVVGVDVVGEQIDESTFEGQLPSVHVHSPSNKGHESSSQRPG